MIAVLNMKGGVGKTTLSANVFHQIVAHHQVKTLIVDFDPQFNLSQLLLRPEEYESYIADGRSLWSVMHPTQPTSVFAVAEDDLIECGDPSTYTVLLRRLRARPTVTMDLLPGDFRLSMLNLSESQSRLRTAQLRFSSFLRRARQVYDLIILDCNPSTSFLTRYAIESCTHLLVPVRPDKYSILGLRMLLEYVNALPTLAAPPATIVVINDLARVGPTPTVVAELRGHVTFGPMTLATAVHSSSLLQAHPEHTGFAVDRKVPYRLVLARNLRLVANEIHGVLEL